MNRQSYLNPFSTKAAVQEMLARGEIMRYGRIELFMERHPVLTAIVIAPLFYALLLGICLI